MKAFLIQEFIVLRVKWLKVINKVVNCGKLWEYFYTFDLI